MIPGYTKGHIKRTSRSWRIPEADIYITSSNKADILNKDVPMRANAVPKNRRSTNRAFIKCQVAKVDLDLRTEDPQSGNI